VDLDLVFRDGLSNVDGELLTIDYWGTGHE